MTKLSVFYLEQDYNLRMGGGLCIVRGQPAIVRIQDGGEIVAETLLGNVLRKVSKEEVDLSPIEFGNVYDGETYAYIVRKPHRHPRQTVTRDALFVYPMPFDLTFEPCRVNARMQSMIVNQYPSVEDALRAVYNRSAVAVPFHKELGIAFRNKLLFKNEIIGEFKSDHIRINKDKFYLKELVESVVCV